MKKYFFSYCLLIIGLLFSIQIQAQQIPDRPTPARAVNDLANIINAQQQSALEQRLRNYQDTTSTTVVIVTVPSLNGGDAFSYTHKLAQTWGVGRDDVDNGLVIMIAPNDRKAFIAPGKGLEGVITDMDCGRIVDFVMIPKFKEGKYYEGINEATNVAFKLMAGEFKSNQLVQRKGRRGGQQQRQAEEIPMRSILLFVFIVIIFLFVLPRFFGSNQNRYKKRGQRGYTYGDRGVDPFGGTIIISNGNNWGSFSSGSGDFSGGGDDFGGGFEGFGGGDFGGGGAGGSW